MRWLFKALMMLVIMAGLSSYASYLITGRSPWSRLQQIPKPDFGLPDLPKPSTASLGSSEVLPVYKWRNEEGIWHYTTDPPPEGIEYQVIDLDPDANRVDGWSKLRREAARQNQATGESAEAPGTGEQAPALYSPSGVKKLINDAREAREQMEQRSRAQQDALGEL